MNKVIIIGNLTKDPELRQTADGISVCNFTVAVNRRTSKDAQHPEADYFRVAAWRELGENCAKYLGKGKKCAVTGSVSARSYTDTSGTARAALEMNADNVEFLTPRDQAAGEASGFVKVDEDFPEGDGTN